MIIPVNSIAKTRWDEAVKNPLSATILTYLLKVGATNPQNAVTYTAIAKALGCHKWQVRRVIAGEGGKRRRKSLLRGLVHYPERYKHSGCYLTPEGIEVAQMLAEGRTPSDADLEALAEARQRRIAESHAESVKCHAKTVKCHAFPYNMPLNLYVCPEGDTSKPANGLAERLWRVYGMALSVANSVVTCYESDAILAAIELRERRNGTIYNPAGFILHLLKHGYAARYAEAKRARQDPNLLAEKVKEAVEGLGLPVAEIDGRPAMETPNGWLILPPDPERAKEVALRFALPVKTDQPAKDAPDAATDAQNEPDISDGQPDSEPDAITDSEPIDSEPTESEPIDPEPNPFELYPFAAPCKLPPSMSRDRAERAAEIAAFDQPLQPLGEPQRAYRRCPRCGRESKDLQLKRFERTYRQVNDAELERWDGVEVCFGEPASCYDSLKKHEVAALKRHCRHCDIDDLTEPQLPTPTKLPFAPMAQSPPSLTFAATEPPTPISSVIDAILPTVSATNEPDNQSNEAPNLTDCESHDCELVRCPRCGRKVPKARVGKSGVCLDCIEAELRERRRVLASHAKEVTNDDNQRGLDKGQALQSQRSPDLPQVWQ